MFQGFRASGPLLGGPIIASSLIVSLPSIVVPASRRRYGDCCVGVGNAVIEAEAAVGCADPLGVAEVFEGYGNAVEGAARTAFGELTVGVFGLLEGEVGGGG